MNYTHVQATGATQWNVTHNLSTTDLVVDVLINTPGGVKKALPKSVKTTGDNTAVITFSTAVAGKARFVKGDGSAPVTFPTYTTEYNIWNPLLPYHSPYTLISNNNKTMYTNQTSWTGGKGNYYISGIKKYYWEVEYTGKCYVGIASFNWSNMLTMGDSSEHITCGINTDVVPLAPIYNSSYASLLGYTSLGSGTRLMFALDVGPGKLWVGRGGSWWRGDPSTVTDPVFLFNTGYQMTLAGVVYDSSANLILKMDPSEFSYTIPTGFEAWVV